jgi:tetratricopeptide (TPR) repeat protein
MAEQESSGAAGLTSGKRHQNVTELELAFAQNPNSNAYVPLCEAYLEQGRLMEAMVVCKKGLKANPDSVDAKILMARVYAKQKKFAKALQEMDDLIAAKGDSAKAHVARAKLRLENNDEPNAVADLKRAIDLDKEMSEATQLLEARGITYPEKPKPPPPPPLPPPTADIPHAGAVLADAAASGDPNAGVATIPPPPLPSGAPGATPTSSHGHAPRAHGHSGRSAPRKRRLEGEDELEALAQKVAEEKPHSGSARASLALLIGGVVVVLGSIGYLTWHRRTIEGIERGTRSGRDEFNVDTYGSYKKAAASFEEILDKYDSSHPLTIAQLAHTYAILWGEHGETDRKPALEKIVEKAAKKAPDVSHTVAAQALVALYGGDDRQKAAQAAYAIAQPFVKRVKEAGGGASVADMTMAIADLELGNYESAASELREVVQAMPNNVRAKVWLGRAAARNGRFAEAERAFESALRASADHPGARAGRALVRIQRGNLEGAAEDVVKFKEFAKKYPKEVSERDKALAFYAESEVMRGAGDDMKANLAYENAIQIDPANADFPYGLGRWQLAHGHAKEALEPLKKAVKMEPARRAFLVVLAEAETSLSEFDAASQHLETALKANPQDLPAAIAKAQLLTAKKDPEAEKYAQGVVGWSQGALEANLELGRVFRAVGKKTEAKSVLEKAIDGMGQYPPTLQSEVLLEYAKLMSEQNEEETALRSFKQAAELGAIEAWYRIAVMLAKADKEGRKQARDACERYLAAGTSLPFSNQARTLCQGI